MIKHHDQKQLGKERVYLAYTSTSLFIIKGSQDRNSTMAEPGGRISGGVLDKGHPVFCRQPSADRFGGGQILSLSHRACRVYYRNAFSLPLISATGACWRITDFLRSGSPCRMKRAEAVYQHCPGASGNPGQDADPGGRRPVGAVADVP